MRIVIPLICLACLAGADFLYAEPPPADDSRPEDTRNRESRTREPRHDTPPPAPTFTPSEKVGADSAVAFPVDI
jgi:hypothetical protein